ncbi:hypothetical protein ACO0RG_002769 [Hanseniaspora osmophila]|uniref:Uncharacterized protein n=1 Tax=Hanseniaspora osmophila TaxID=56408 RepID=A0A1E5R862_9ASCO|nr:hypothetical protein AWRI3579_g3294 [Hanseniaspora osmophila]
MSEPLGEVGQTNEKKPDNGDASPVNFLKNIKFRKLSNSEKKPDGQIADQTDDRVDHEKLGGEEYDLSDSNYRDYQENHLKPQTTNQTINKTITQPSIPLNNMNTNLSRTSTNDSSESSETNASATNPVRFIPRTLPIGSIDLEEQAESFPGGTNNLGANNFETQRDSSYRLWKDIDVLDDVKSLIKEHNTKDNANTRDKGPTIDSESNNLDEFPKNYEQELKQLRSHHLKLLNKLREYKNAVSSSTSILLGDNDMGNDPDGPGHDLMGGMSFDVKKNSRNNLGKGRTIDLGDTDQQQQQQQQQLEDANLTQRTLSHNLTHTNTLTNIQTNDPPIPNSISDIQNLLPDEHSLHNKELDSIVDLLNQLQNK